MPASDTASPAHTSGHARTPGPEAAVPTLADASIGWQGGGGSSASCGRRQDRSRSSDLSTCSSPRLFVSFDADLDWLTCLEFGLVDDGQPPERWRGLAPWFGFYETADGRVAGFKIPSVEDIDLDDPDVAEAWDGPRFDAPQLGLIDVPAAEIVIAALTHFDGESSLNRLLFDAAAGESGERALGAWRHCLESGDAMAHFGLGCALLEDGQAHLAYRHLRHYAHLAPAHPWNWCWYGQAAEALGEVDEARDAYRRAVELDDEDEPETDAAARLDGLAPRR